MGQPTVSAVIPVYNNGPFIAAAVRSVLDQTRAPTEVIVVDDGSTDNTASELKPYLPRIKYVYQQNRGEPSARNRGIVEAASDYVAFLDGDDLWAPNKLELQMEYLRQHPNCGLVYADMSTFSDQGIIDASVKQSLRMSFPSGRIFSHLFKRPLFGSGTVVLRKNCVQTVGYFDEELLVGCDYEMWMRIALNFDAGFVDKPLLMYRYHPAMSTRGTGRKMYNGVPWEVVVLRKILQRYPTVSDEIGRSTMSQRLSKPYAGLALAQFRLNDHEKARPLFRKAADLWPTNLRYWAFYAATFLHPSQIAAARKFYRHAHSPFNARRSANPE
jgi:glycosyltransferase involved in cell wall biosynthesis